MPREESLSRVLASVPELFALSKAEDILVRACKEMRALTHASVVLATYAAPPAPWEQGLHLSIADVVMPVEGPLCSAMFAVHRRIATSRSRVVIEGSGADARLFDVLTRAAPGTRAVHAVPLFHRTGRLVGEVLLLGAGPPSAEEMQIVDELAKLTTASLENAQRLGMARRDQDRLLLVSETTDEALWDWNLETGEVWWGGGLWKILGSHVEVENRVEWKAARIHPDDAERVRTTLAAAATTTASTWTESYRFRRGDGTWAQVEDRAHFLREANGHAFRAIGALRDVTSLHESAEALRENERRLREALAESDVANRAKDEFLAMLGHELRNPLSPMGVALQLLHARGQTSRELDVLERQVAHLSRLVDDLLDVSRITRGKIELRREVVEVSTAVARALDVVRPMLERRGHGVALDVPRGLSIDADAARVTQIFSNLLTNAAKYSDAGSKIHVGAVEIDDRVQISVTDEGVGIEPAMIERVFEMFVQRPQTIERSQGGLGLGLAIVKSLVELHGGTVRAESAGLGHGSTFVVDLPLSSQVEVPLAPPSQLGASKIHPALILIVDDNRDGAEMMQEALERVGHHVIVAHDGPTAVELALARQPRVMLLDIGLPVMDGYEVATAIRNAGARLRQPKIVAITGYGQEEDRRRTAAAGFDLHLVKPVNIRDLVGIIESLTIQGEPAAALAAAQ